MFAPPVVHAWPTVSVPVASSYPLGVTMRQVPASPPDVRSTYAPVNKSSDAPESRSPPFPVWTMVVALPPVIVPDHNRAPNSRAASCRRVLLDVEAI